MIINGGEINGTSINGLYAPIAAPLPVVVKKVISSLFFECTITGATDVIIPISNISGELVAGGTSTVSIVCPNGSEYSRIISDRSAGNIIINTTELYTDGTSSVVGSDQYEISYISHDKGARSWSISLTGKAILTPVNSAKYIASGVSYINTNTLGKRRVRLDYNSDLRVDDALIVDDSEMTVGSISYVINSNQSYMYCSEL